MADIAIGWLAGRQLEDVDDPMEDAAADDPALPSSSSSAAPPSSVMPPSPVHCTMTIGEARAHYIDMVREEQTEAAYNHHLLQEHMQAVAPDADLTEQEALLQSYCSAREIRLARWRYRQPVAAPANDDEAGETLFGETEEEEEENNAEAVPNKAGTSADARKSSAREVAAARI